MAFKGDVLAAVVLTAFLAGACAAPADTRRMTVTPGATVVSAENPLARAVCVEKVDGGKTTNPLWVSEVGNADFLAALEGSLRNKGLLAEGPDICLYGIEAHLLGLSQPFVSFDVEVTANVNYRVRKPGALEPYLLETVTSDYTARFSADKVLWAVRLKEANEGAIRKNIRKFIQALTAHPPGA